MTIRAGWSTATGSFSTRAIKSTIVSFGRVSFTATVAGSVAVAVPTPSAALIACATARAVAKSGLRSASLASRMPSNENGTSRSTMAPDATRADVVTPRLRLAPAPRAATPDTATGPWATANTSPFIACSGVAKSVPPCSDDASPIADT